MSYDIFFQPIPIEDQPYAGMKLFTFGFTSAIGVQGAPKLVNRWLKCFMTTKGSDPFDATIGTGFPNLYGSNIVSLTDLSDAMILFIEDCNSQMFSWDQLYLPPDSERLLSATLTQILPRGRDGFDAWVNIRNVAGTSLSIQLPTIPLR